MVLKAYLKYAAKGSPEFTAKVSLPDAWLATEPCRSVLRLFVCQVPLWVHDGGEGDAAPCGGSCRAA